MTAAWTVRELCPLPRFYQPMSKEQCTETRLFSSGWDPLQSASDLSSFRDSWQLVLATISTAFPTCLSLCLNVEEFRVGMFMFDSTFLIWVWPIPAWRQARATRVLTSKADGPRLPDLCSPEVQSLFPLPQKGQTIENVLANPCRISSLTL